MKRITETVCILLAVLLLGGCVHQSAPLPQAPTTTTAETTTTATEGVTTTVTTTATTTVITTAATTTKLPIIKQTTKKPTTVKPTTTIANTPVVTPTTTQSVVTPPTVSAVQQEVLRIVNEERAKVGAAPLVYCPAAQAAADIRAQEIVEKFSHTRPNGTEWYTAIAALDIEYYGAGENIAYGQQDAVWVMRDWMNSEGHKKNILSTTYNAIVVGYVVKDGIPYWVQLFLKL